MKLTSRNHHFLSQPDLEKNHGYFALRGKFSKSPVTYLQTYIHTRGADQGLTQEYFIQFIEELVNIYKQNVNMNKEKVLLLCLPLTAPSMDALQNYHTLVCLIKLTLLSFCWLCFFQAKICFWDWWVILPDIQGA